MLYMLFKTNNLTFNILVYSFPCDLCNFYMAFIFEFLYANVCNYIDILSYSIETVLFLFLCDYELIWNKQSCN